MNLVACGFCTTAYLFSAVSKLVKEKYQVENKFLESLKM
jgi:aerobic-type carbon monoxide dehydrogenase small subunit (CoxS/CutS family)